MAVPPFMLGSAEVLWVPLQGSPSLWSCVDCGLATGNFCDGGRSVGYDQCFASDRVPQDYTDVADRGRQRTPLCTYCGTCCEFCRFCRGVLGWTPPRRDNHWSGVPQSQSRVFTLAQSLQAERVYWATCPRVNAEIERTASADERRPRAPEG